MRRLLGPSLMTLAMVAVLCGLGVWQLRRLEWKRGILAAIDHAEAAAPVPLPAHPARFQKVGVTGRLRPDLAVRYSVDVRDLPGGSIMGSQLIEPLERADEPPVLVDLGWAPDDAKPVAGVVTLAGFVRWPERPGPFAVADDPAARRFYTLDPLKMAHAVGLADAIPFTLVALGADTAVPPIPSTALPRPPNDHLGYALTWFGLAVVLLVMFFSWARTAVRGERLGGV